MWLCGLAQSIYSHYFHITIQFFSRCSRGYGRNGPAKTTKMEHNGMLVIRKSSSPSSSSNVFCIWDWDAPDMINNYNNGDLLGAAWACCARARGLWLAFKSLGRVYSCVAWCSGAFAKWNNGPDTLRVAMGRPHIFICVLSFLRGIVDKWNWKCQCGRQQNLWRPRLCTSTSWMPLCGI